MKKRFFTILFFTCFYLCPLSYATSLIDTAIFFSDEGDLQGKKVFIYDENDNITSVDIFDADNNLETKCVYQYNNSVLQKCTEYSGSTPIKYITFDYDAKTKSILTRKEFDKNNNLLLVTKIFVTNKVVTKTEDYSIKDDYLGKKEFVYSNNRLIEEKSCDAINKFILTKKYLYSNDLLDKIDFYYNNNRLIRTIKITYKESILGTKSYLGYPENFVDIR